MSLISNSKYFVDEVNSSKANKFISAYHYSHRGFPAAKLNLGIFTLDTKELVGVLQWGRSGAYNIKLDRYVKNPIKVDEYFELNRFAMADSEGKNSESQAISLALKWIKKYRKGIRLLVSYAGRVEGNYGYIYQATNWEYLGYFISKAFYSIDGLEYHLTTVATRYRNFKDKYKTLEDYLCGEYHNVYQYDSKQFIYIQRLDKKLIPASAILPYPKPTNEFPIQTKVVNIQTSKDFINSELEIEKPVYYWSPREEKFTTAMLRRHGVETKHRTEYQYLIYDMKGNFAQLYNSIKEILADYPQLNDSGIRTNIKKEKSYKGFYFKQIPYGQYYEEKIKVAEPLCYIDDIPFYKQIEIARYVGVTRQAVSSCFKKKNPMIGGKNIIWSESQD